jgi:hypothetical protein
MWLVESHLYQQGFCSILMLYLQPFILLDLYSRISHYQTEQNECAARMLLHGTRTGEGHEHMCVSNGITGAKS